MSAKTRTRLRILSPLAIALFVSADFCSLPATAGTCPLNYTGARIPLAPEGRLVQMIREEHHAAYARAYQIAEAKKARREDFYEPDERAVLSELAKTPKLPDEDCGAPFYAAAYGFPRTLEAMIDRHMDVRVGEPQTGGMNAVNAAAYEGSLSTVRVLIERNVFDVNGRGGKYLYQPMPFPFIPAIGGDMTPLYYAVSGRHPSIVRYLVTKGADVNAKTVMGRTPLAAAQLEGNREMEALLKELGAK